MVTLKQILVSWVLLILLTLTSVYIGKILENNTLFVITVFLIVFLKGQQITDVFMELREAPRMWRLLLLSYVFIVPAIICAIYLL
jgi:cytochrome c oxidase subunit IV